MSETESNGQATEPTVEERLRTLEARLSDVEARRREIEASAAEVDRLASSAEKKKAAYTAAKHAWEEAVEGHMELSRNWSKSEEVTSRPLIKACEAKADPVPADDSWREEPIEVLEMCGLGGDVVVILGDDNGLRTLGDLADWSRDHDGYNGIDRIGKAKAQQIEDAFMRYWDARAADVQDADDAEEDDLDAAEDAEAVADFDVSDPSPEKLEAMGIETEERSGLDLVTSRPDSDPESNGVEATESKTKRRRKAKV